MIGYYLGSGLIHQGFEIPSEFGIVVMRNKHKQSTGTHRQNMQNRLCLSVTSTNNKQKKENR